MVRTFTVNQDSSADLIQNSMKQTSALRIQMHIPMKSRFLYQPFALGILTTTAALE